MCIRDSTHILYMQENKHIDLDCSVGYRETLNYTLPFCETTHTNSRLTDLYSAFSGIAGLLCILLRNIHVCTHIHTRARIYKIHLTD